MDGPEAGRTMRLGGLIFAGAALLAVGAVGLQWRMAPTLLRLPVIEFVFVGAGLLVVLIGLVSLALDRRSVVHDAPRPARPRDSSSGSSLMALPALVTEQPVASPSAPAFSPLDATPTPATVMTALPVGLASAGASNSTLLIPFAQEPALTTLEPVSPVPGVTVSQLVDRMSALQRVAPSGVSAHPTPTATLASVPLPTTLELRLTRIPTPPSLPSATSVARRCNDCGDPLGSPPQFEPCADCGRALCERCYWQTSSGPQAHLCASCFRDRSVPRPPTPAVTFGGPEPGVSVATPSGRTLQPRRPAN
jgi:hypothetical protein